MYKAAFRIYSDTLGPRNAKLVLPFPTRKNFTFLHTISTRNGSRECRTQTLKCALRSDAVDCRFPSAYSNLWTVLTELVCTSSDDTPLSMKQRSISITPSLTHFTLFPTNSKPLFISERKKLSSFTVHSATFPALVTTASSSLFPVYFPDWLCSGKGSLQTVAG